MLIEFIFENFRAARDEQRFSMVAGSYKEHRETHLFRPHGVPANISTPDLLRSAALYGPNAGGKSNFIQALQVFQTIITRSASWGPEQKLPVTPFLFSSKTRTEPSSFEAIFVSKGVRYQYGFAATESRVTEEWLFAFPLGKAQRWFTREYNAEINAEKFYFNDKLLGEKETWRKATRPNALLLSTAVQLNSEQLLPVYRWFAEKMRIVGDGGHLHPVFSLEQFRSGHRGSILAFLQKADLSIHDLQIETQKVQAKDLPNDFIRRIYTLEERRENESTMVRLYNVKSLHKTSEGELVPLDLQEESDGTQKMLRLAGPWLDTLENGYTLIVDELHQNLHPKLLRHLLEMFHDPGLNKSGAQLVFTTHNTSILDQDLFRRDQVWLFERTRDQASQLYPLSDFKVRKGVENLERAYLSGRYGGLPFLRRFDLEGGKLRAKG